MFSTACSVLVCFRCYISITPERIWKPEPLKTLSFSDFQGVWKCNTEKKWVNLFCFLLLILNIRDALRDLVHLFNLRNLKNTHGEVLLLVKLQASACNFNESSTPSWVFFMFIKLYKWYQIAQRITYH